MTAHESFSTPVGRELAKLASATDAELTAIATAAVENASTDDGPPERRAMTTDSRFRAPRVTTYVTPRGTIHALDTMRTDTVTGVCGQSLLLTGMMMRSSATADAYVTCKRCAARLADGVTVSAATVRRARLASQLSEPIPGTRHEIVSADDWNAGYRGD